MQDMWKFNKCPVLTFISQNTKFCLFSLKHAFSNLTMYKRFVKILWIKYMLWTIRFVDKKGFGNTKLYVLKLWLCKIHSSYLKTLFLFFLFSLNTMIFSLLVESLRATWITTYQLSNILVWNYWNVEIYVNTRGNIKMLIPEKYFSKIKLFFFLCMWIFVCLLIWSDLSLFSFYFYLRH